MADNSEISWQRRAVDSIEKLTTVAQLEQALGKPFVKALRSWRRQVEGRDTAGTKAELVEALLVQNGADLLRNCKDLRKVISAATGAGAPGSFHSGKAGAIGFVEAAKLPIELAGSPAPPRPPAAMVVRGPQYLRDLEDYQREAKEQIAAALRHGSAVICSLPTGGGKTRVAIEAVVELLCHEIDACVPNTPRVMWVAHTRELCDQAVEVFRVVWEMLAAGKNLLIGTTAAVGDNLETPFREAMQEEQWDAAVIVTTPIVGERLLSPHSWLGNLLCEGSQLAVRALFIDEAHRAAAPTYRRLISSARRVSRVPVIGLTATPFRTVAAGQPPDAATVDLRSIFDGGLILPSRLGLDPKGVLIERQCLARPTYTAIQGTDLEISAVGDQGEEWIDSELGKLAGKNLPRRQRVFRALKQVLEDSPEARILYFGPTVTDAEVMSFLLLKQGYRSAVVSAKTHASVRRQIVRQFKSGAYHVLCNHGVLTTGFDDPKITHVVVARPTVSLAARGGSRRDEIAHANLA